MIDSISNTSAIGQILKENKEINRNASKHGLMASSESNAETLAKLGEHLKNDLSDSALSQDTVNISTKAREMLLNSVENSGKSEENKTKNENSGSQNKADLSSSGSAGEAGETGETGEVSLDYSQKLLAKAQEELREAQEKLAEAQAELSSAKSLEAINMAQGKVDAAAEEVKAKQTAVTTLLAKLQEKSGA